MSKSSRQSKAAEGVGNVAHDSSHLAVLASGGDSPSLVTDAAQAEPGKPAAAARCTNAKQVPAPVNDEHTATIKSLGALLAKMVLRCAVENSQHATQDHGVLTFQAPVE